ncbi:glycosyl hydrolase family 8 [Pseudobacillus sp. 179-B 2D1 NHS]|uniref:glycosyl hydrolase family 8 n=1 Tax=Pseudobacillus sp. 179-B 2D1 NHS TaxID=3374292 RepID=UPI00387A6761
MKNLYRRWGFWILVIILLISLVFFTFYGQENGKEDSREKRVVETVNNHYINTKYGLIQAYPNQPNSQYLSESIGLYMDYLLHIENKEAFNKLYNAFYNYFVVAQKKETYVKWELDNETNTNALIDDVRIIAALQKAGQIFKEPKYEQLAQSIQETISKNQKRQGYYVDFYDWSMEKPSARITLSYLTPDFFSLFPNTEQSKQLLIHLNDNKDPFFPEYFDIEKETYAHNKTVHMIDQLLIAINRKNIGYNSDNFNQWLLKEWDDKHKLFGQYDRQSLQPSVSYESLSVYYYLQAYLKQIGKQDVAEEVIKRAKQLENDPILYNAHFFDYIHSEYIFTY